MLVLGEIGLHAQEAIPASGGNASGSDGTVSYSIGQTVYSIHEGTNGTEVQGVQQPFEITVVTGIYDAKWISLSVKVYPNPTTQFLTLVVNEPDISDLSYELYDLDGKILIKKGIKDSQTQIAVERFAASIYFLKIMHSTAEIKTFKIIKH